FFTRVRAPEKGSRPVQLGLEQTSSPERHAWAKHPSNIIPAINRGQWDLVKKLDEEYRNNKKNAYQWNPERLLQVGVDASILLPNKITKDTADELVNDFNRFVIHRWAPDISGQTDGTDIEFEDED
ncbi:MAG: hypothetical protein VBE63_27345, partial [Lamprobacter sp.]|uniref:hypothetical protein n=1 Tax=Lamprobacter sp. TaxID=3100796 RepID=UPI002B260F99